MSRNPIMIEKDQLHSMYWNQKMNQCQIADELGCSRYTIIRRMSKYGIRKRSHDKRNRRYSINQDFFKIWSHDMAYILGIIASDGYVGYYRNKFHFSICSDDKKLLCDIKKAMQSDHNVKKYRNRNSYRLNICGAEMAKDLINIGITPRKTRTLKFPEVPDEFLCSFVRGYFDGDGCVHLRKESNSIRVAICSASIEFISQLMLLLREHELKVNLRKETKFGVVYNIVRIDKKSEVKKFYGFIYRHNKICLERKKVVFDNFFVGEERNETK